MKRLLQENLNTPEHFDNLFFEKGNLVDPFDIKRWKLLLRHFRRNWFDTTRIIDLGCLYSRVPQLAKRNMYDRNLEVWGLDQAEEAIKWLKISYPEINYVVGDIYDTRLPNEYFDYVVMGEVIEHLDYPILAIKEAMRILKPKGWLAISTPLDESRDIGAVDLEHHVFSFDKNDLRNMLDIYGKVKLKVLGSDWFPYKYHFKVLIAYCKKYAS